MPIINREKDQSEQKDLFDNTFQGVGTGVTLVVAVLPYTGYLAGAISSAAGLSGAPVHSLSLMRFVPGAGVTTQALGATITVTVFGTSGIQGYSSAAMGNTGYFGSSLPLQSGDLVVLTTGVANAAVATLTVEVVTRCLQDYKSYYGITL
jgi:hypothetical protein